MIKDPQARLDYAFDWADWLGEGETITDATITVTGVTKVTSTVLEGKRVVVRLSGGTAGERASAVCHITTSTGQEDDRTMKLTVEDR